MITRADIPYHVIEILHPILDSKANPEKIKACLAHAMNYMGADIPPRGKPPHGNRAERRDGGRNY